MKQLSLFDAIEIPLTQGYVALVDPCDADLLDFNWQMRQATNNRTQYATRYAQQHPIKHAYMHRIILARVLERPLDENEIADHINGNGLDNRRINLRVCTRSQNRMNSNARFNSKSGFKGVSWHKQSQKWHARIFINGIGSCLGYHDTPEAAAEAYNAAAIQHFGDFARLNAIPAAPQSQEAR